MGNREDLLAGAKQCLLDKGFGRTTARDIATAAGVSLAAIGYHYGSKEALMTEALIGTMSDWGDSVEAAMAGVDPSWDQRQRAIAVWKGIIDSFPANRGLWLVQFEIMAQSETLPQLRDAMLAVQDLGRFGLAEMFGWIDAENAEGAEREEALIFGGVHQAMLIGLISQLLVSPATAPSPEQLADALSGTRMPTRH